MNCLDYNLNKKKLSLFISIFATNVYKQKHHNIIQVVKAPESTLLQQMALKWINTTSNIATAYIHFYFIYKYTDITYKHKQSYV